MLSRIMLNTTQRSTALLAGALLAIGTACSAEPTVPTADDPALYVTALDLLFARDSAAGPVVLVDQVLEVDSSAIDAAVANMPIVDDPDSVSRNFTAKSLRAGRVPSITDIRSRTTTIASVASPAVLERLRAQADSDRLREPQRFVTSVEPYWARVHQEFAPARTLVQLSPAAYSRDGRHAIMYITYSCGELCGGSYWVAFSRNRSGWTVRHVRPTSVS